MPARLGMWIGLAALSVGSLAARAADSTAVIVGIERSGDLPAALALTGAVERARALSGVLQSKVGFDDVRLLVGEEATRSALSAAFQASLDNTAPGGLILWVLEGRGIGGDYGDPYFLPADARLAQLDETGLDMAALAHGATSDLGDRTLVVVIDSSHAGAHDRLALVGATVDDWPSTSSQVGVISAAGQGQAAAVGGLIPVVTKALEGAADGNGDGRITWSELSTYVTSGHGVDALDAVRTGGSLAGDRTMARLPETSTPPPAPTPVSASAPVPWKAISWGAIIAGGVSGAVSLGMYTAKRSACETRAGQTSCGSDAAYGRYQRTQHALGWLGGGLIATGVGLQFVGLEGPLQVRVHGRF